MRKLLENIETEFASMDVVDDILQYIPDISDNDFLDNSEFILLSPFAIQTSANDEENKNYGENKKINEEYKDDNWTHTNSGEAREDNTKDKHPSTVCGIKAKRGRPPCKPPSKEVVRSRRKVGILSSTTPLSFGFETNFDDHNHNFNGV